MQSELQSARASLETAKAARAGVGRDQSLLDLAALQIRYASVSSLATAAKWRDPKYVVWATGQTVDAWDAAVRWADNMQCILDWLRRRVSVSEESIAGVVGPPLEDYDPTSQTLKEKIQAKGQSFFHSLTGHL